MTRAGVPAVVTAGGRLTGPLADAAGTDLKALAPVGGVPMLARVVTALRGCAGVGRIVVVGPVERVEALACAAGADTVLPEGATGPENVERGLRDAAAEARTFAHGQALLAATDAAFLTPGAVASLLEQAGALGDADIVFPVIARADYERVFPGSPNVWTPLGGAEWTGGSLQMVRADALERNRALIERVFAARKSQWEMARLLGLGFALRFKMGKLTIADAEARASQLTGCRCRALVGADPRLAADIDDLADWQWAESFAAQTGKVGV